jgi:spoIIIJ-associated protein
VEEAPPPVEAVGRHAEAAREAASRLLSLAGLPAGVRVLARPDRLDVDLSGAGEPRLLAHDGELLLAIEHLLPRVVRGLVGEPVAVRADCGSFQEIKERRLRELALSVAAEVRRRGLPHTLQELGPAERRIIHLELAADPTVTTESVGEGYYKRITVRPAG